MRELMVNELLFVYGGVSRKADSNDIHHFNLVQGDSYKLPSTLYTWMLCVTIAPYSDAKEGMVSCNGDEYSLEAGRVLGCYTKAGMLINATQPGTLMGQVNNEAGVCMYVK